MDTFLNIILGTIIGTSAMTAFSYIVSAQYRKMFQEPRLLHYVIKLCHLSLSDTTIVFISWVLHYVLGLLFVIGYHVLWRCCMELSWWSGLILGAASGIIGIIGWIMIFSLPSEKPRVAFTSYFIQLFFAHIVFAAGVVAVYRVLPI